MSNVRVEAIASSIVREYLSRKGLKGTLQSMDEEMPRSDGCISNRQALMKELRIEKLMKKNKEMVDPLRAMIEVITKYLLDRNDGNLDRPISSKDRRQQDDCSPDTQYSPGTDKLDFKFSSEAMAAASSKRKTAGSAASSAAPTKSETGDLVIEDNLESETILGDGKSGVLAQESPEITPSTQKSRPRSSTKHRGLSGPVTSNLDDRRRGQRPRPMSGVSRKGSVPSSTSNEKEVSTVMASNKEPLMVTPKTDLESIDSLISRPLEHRKSIQNVLDVDAPVKTGKMSRRQNSVEKEEPHYSVDKSSISKQPASRDTVQQRPSSFKSTSTKVGDVEIGDVDDLDNEVANLDLGPRLPVGRPIQNLLAARPISLQTAVNLKTIIFGSANQNFNDEWRHQSFTFCDLPSLKFGIVQKKGGPCGVLAAVQACVLQEMLFGDSPVPSSRFSDPSIEERSGCLATALARIFWRAGENRTAVVVLPSGKPQFQASKGKYKQDDLTETLMINHFKTHSDLKNFIIQNLSQFELDGTSGVILALYSCIMSRFMDLVRSDMDEPTGKLMGAHGYCTQDMVNLILTGRAVSNVFNDVVELESGDGTPGTILKGPNTRADTGLLSLFEHYRSCQVGTYLKTPRFPIWVICSESHFSVLFSLNKELVSNWKAERRFDLFYYDGLARQQELIKLTIDTTIKYEGGEEELVPPLEHCIRTKWKGAVVDWNGTEPLL
ncbi:probable ubiquitin carboxyl-terminal hydrolase MINDY-4 [Ylistrum balloti]|uniref:probable ubiquitin carboxyl-terminal hydrolase MINDY-4 n=1 Tax=Ylistrum balloti TaxID=509963 RepID=UPI002905A6B9|nr:probable ubiquitin carboxyl-terminal hydrolase MINDY-4 [Ylistrum balloti]